MPLILRALPLSFQTFWRYLILLPVLAVATVVMSLIGAFIPVFNFLIPGTISAFCVIVGLRCALAAQGYRRETDMGQLLLASVIFCIMSIIANQAIEWIVSGILKVAGLVAIGLGYDIALLTELFVLIPVLGGVFLLKCILIATYVGAIAVPMTTAAADDTYRVSGRNLFFGFGTGMFSLFLITVIWLSGGQFYAIFGEVWATFGLVASALIAIANGTEIPWSTSFQFDTLLVRTLFMTWASSWFFATAILAWEKARQRNEKTTNSAMDTNRVSSDDIRALRAARDKGNHVSTES
ncbi:hypothetical protein [Parasulfitobacter algicola]|uniref:Integral membrane protein n=1 Tax=Parasulfitobacter algicola TaxID=2614809 RepID=A0ABX2IUH4_9RHOB|nr:hypothetical protein [Sulfitobacter algicola]NSX56539.1 hypothetical protein [Sulfitobacter algicola]